MKKITALIAVSGAVAALSAGCGGQTQTPTQRAQAAAQRQCARDYSAARAWTRNYVSSIGNVSPATVHQLMLTTYKLNATEDHLDCN